MKHSALPLAMMALIPWQLCSGQHHGQRIAPDGRSEISAVLAGSTIRVVFRAATVPISASDPSSRRYAQCTYSRVPCSLTEDIQISANGHEVFVPRAAYADLGDISSAELTTNHGRMILTIQGGDASESYIAKLTFNRQRVLERRLYSGEDADHPLEISHFYQ